MSNLLARLKAARQSGVTVVDRFIREYAKCGDGAYVFVEGKHDKIFYQGIVRKFLKRKSPIKLFVCGNKKAVIDAAAMIKGRALPAKISTLFFVDHDFDYYFTKCKIPETVFCSRGYSFENYVIDRDNMELAWDSCVTTASSGLDFDLLSRIFMREYAKFAKVMLEFSAQVICRRQNLRMDEKITLQNGKLGRLMNIDDDLIISYDNNLINVLSCQVGLRMMKRGAKCVERIRLALKEKGSKYYIRGKYLIVFIQKFLEGVQALGKKIDTNFSFDIQINDRNIVNYIVNRGNVPSELSEYVKIRLASIA